MKLKDIRDSYYSHTGNASSVSRQAAFAGIALIWVFKTDSNQIVTLPIDLLLPAFFFVLCLTSDLLQYLVSSAIWGYFHRAKEKVLGVDYQGDITAPKYLNWPALLFFWSKLLLVIIGYFFLFKYVLSSIVFIVK